MKQKNIRVVIVAPKLPAIVTNIPNTLEAKKKIVGGYIECVRYNGFDIIINEEGKLLDLEPNFSIYDGMDYIAGTAIFAGVDYPSGEFKSLTQEQIDLILNGFHKRGMSNGQANQSN